MSECAVCLETMEQTTCVKTHCCSQMLHLPCYMKCENCPFCRSEQPRILPVIILKHDYPRLFKIVFSLFVSLGFVSLLVLGAECSDGNVRNKLL